MQRRMSPDEKTCLSTFVKDWRLKNEGGTQEQCAIDANKAMNFPDYHIRTFTVIPFWGGPSKITVKAPENQKRKYTKRSKKEEVEETDVEKLLEEVPTIAGLIKKLEDIKFYACKIQEVYKKQLEKLFLA